MVHTHKSLRYQNNNNKKKKNRCPSPFRIQSENISSNETTPPIPPTTTTTNENLSECVFLFKTFFYFIVVSFSIFFIFSKKCIFIVISHLFLTAKNQKKDLNETKKLIKHKTFAFGLFHKILLRTKNRNT